MRAGSNAEQPLQALGGMTEPVDLPVPQGCNDSTSRSSARVQKNQQLFAESVYRARARMDAMRPQDWVARREDAALLLKELAQALGAAPIIREDVARAVCVADSHADAVVARQDGPFLGCSHIKAGLKAILEPIERHVRAAELRHLTGWVESARGAAQRVDEGGMVAFEGAAIHDALRTSTDLFLVLAEGTRP